MKDNELPKRKRIRLKSQNYSTAGYYFVTICTKDKRALLCKIDVGRDVLIAPQVKLTKYGEIVQKHINNINEKIRGVHIDKYVIMPNHIHLLMIVENADGAMRTSRPTDAVVPSVVRSFKGLTSKEAGISLWQASYYDHIIRSDEDYLNTWNYIDGNPLKWVDDEYYVSAER